MSTKPKVVKVPIEQVVEDYRFYPRTGVSDAHARLLAQAMEAGEVLPPIRVEAKSMRVIDGFHRLEAHRRLKRQEILAQVEDVKDDADFYERAVAANTAHGRPYVPYEHKRIIIRADELGLTVERISGLLHISIPRIEEIRRGFATTPNALRGYVPLKASVRHLAGKQVTREQEDVIADKLSGWPPMFLADQLLLHIDNGLLDLTNDGLIHKLHYLASRIEEQVPQVVAEVA